ncbi:RecQ family ATP-dependent DNA helicase [Weissella viridescens]|uniref:RecQ family ATP-dependent DNA helicase n=1 Tax=Weissella viridescens TaxID=1629 RepID=UPI002576067B|nr:RecQ family ATP-dependent DNA helicase [Weissella viridescens]WJI90714.1 RecQ family ATP-dependent DNA helicase [Weissella viridescens]
MLNQTDIQATLKQHFGFETFRPGQLEIIEALLRGDAALGMLPTGGGKSLIYQMMGYLRPGTVVIVTPLLSLMQDQVARFNYLGEKSVVALNSTMDAQEKFTILGHLNRYRFVFISPEMLNQANVLQAFQRIQINTFVIDEAHTLLSWGPDFRPDYLDLPRLHHLLGAPSLLLLTATATPAMQEDLKGRFDLGAAQWFTYTESSDRPNIYLHTEELTNQDDKRQRLQFLVHQIPGAGIVYVSSRKMANSLAEFLRQETGKRVAAYHGGLDNVARYRLQQQFMENQLDVIVATSAFGMGIDKDDIRFVIHYHLSQDLANYMQEIGRAGRDGQNAVAILLYIKGDERIQQHLIDASLPTDAMIEGYYAKVLTQRDIGEERARLLDYYGQQNLSVPAIQQLFAERRVVREADLNQMVKYAQSRSALRPKLLGYFGEKASSDFESIGMANWALTAVGLPAAPKEQPHVNQTDWSTILTKLFKLS